jgi:hypothetical protein
MSILSLCAIIYISLLLLKIVLFYTHLALFSSMLTKDYNG